MPVNLEGLRYRIVLAAITACLACQAAWGQHANITLYVFKKGLPVNSIEVLVDGEVQVVTNEQGVAVLEVPAGIHELELRDQDLVILSQPILTHEEEISQWIVNVTRGLSALTDVESSFQGPGGLPAETAEPVDAAADDGTLSGRLVSAEDGRPVTGARIFISGQSADVRTDEDGVFTANLPPAEYSISILHSGHNTLTRDRVEITSSETTRLELELTPSGTELPEFVVLEPYIAGSLASVLEERRLEQAVANILGSEQISKAGDSDAAGALRRVTGLTLVDGKFIYVRGLGERYSSTLLNGANVPSPDATRRVVPLDLFPTSIIDSIAVKKGYTSELPGEFGGGAVEIRTRSMPDEGFFKIEYSMGYRDGTTGQDGLTYAGGGRDWLGTDDGTRGLSTELATAISGGTELRPLNRFTGIGFSPEELEAIGESVPVIYDTQKQSTDPNLGMTLAGGEIWQLDNGFRFGFQAALNYKNEWQSVSQQRTTFTNGGGGVLEAFESYIFDITQRNIDLSGFFTAGAELGEHHQLSMNWMVLRNTTDTTQVEEGKNRDADGGNVRFTELEWTEREMNALQLLGEHTFAWQDGLKFNWQYTTADASSDAPDTRRYRYDPDNLTPSLDDFIFSIRNDSNQRRWSVLTDDARSWNADFTYPLHFFESTDIAVVAGINQVEKARDSAIRRFSFRSRGSISGSLDLRRNPSVEDVIFAETIAPGGWQLEEVTIPTDAYTADQSIDSWHAGLDINIGDSLRLVGGVRDETSSMTVSTFNLFDPGRNPVLSQLDTDDVFPAFSATWVRGDHQLRGGFSETINRPDFKELSESLFKDPILGKLVKGNPDLQAAYIKHFDLRWDYYFSTDEFISFGLFYKKFESPIESVILASADSDLASYDNALAADNSGFEFELYRNLGFFDERWGWGPAWGKFYVNTNYAWISSEITLSDDNAAVQTSNQRPLQGQSPYVLNFQFGYDDPERSVNAALVFNVVGERIVDVGINGSPDIYEQPRESLDFVYSQVFRNWKLKAKLKNLLDPDIELTQGPETTRLSTAGREFSVGVEYSFR